MLTKQHSGLVLASQEHLSTGRNFLAMLNVIGRRVVPFGDKLTNEDSDLYNVSEVNWRPFLISLLILGY